MNILTVENLTAFRNQRPLFKPLNFELKSSEILHIMGHNGSGKSTLLLTLAGLLPLKQGIITWNNASTQFNAISLQREIFYLGHQIALKNQLTVWENLRFFTQLYPSISFERKRLLEHLDVFPFHNVICNRLSAGQKQRVALTKLWLTQAKVWLLDEPFNSLDSNAVNQIKKRLLEHCQTGGAIILTSHHELDLPDVNIKSIQL